MTGRPTPQRITMALDMAGLFGPEADATLGVAEPTVDMWESGLLVPTREQLADLAARAGVTVDWLYEPSLEPMVIQMCYRTKKAAGGGPKCQRVTYPEPPPAAAQGALF